MKNLKMATSILLAFVMVILSHKCQSLAVDSGDTLPLGTSLTGNQTLISENGTFELGFFSLNGTDNWYIGIWYAHISEKTVVWVANRETPLTNMAGALNLSTDGHLRLYDLQGRPIWSTDNSLKGSRAMLQDTGNFVMLGAHNTSETVWESFKYPGDTWLPEMKMWKGMKLSSWKSSLDPAPGPFSLGMDPSPGKTQFLLQYRNSVPYWWSGEWDDDHFTNLPEMAVSTQNGLMEVPPLEKTSPSRMSFTYIAQPKIQMMRPRLVLDKNGELRVYLWIGNSRWSLIWSEPRDQCIVFDLCGAYGACNSNNIQFCSCLQGFTPKDKRAWDSQDGWSNGCVRRSPLQCSASNGTTDGFLQVRDKSLSGGEVVSYAEVQTLQGCQASCLNNCSCTAFAITNSTSPICRLWFGDLLNLQNSYETQTLFIRLAASELEESSSKGRSRARTLSILLPVGTVGLASVLALLLALFIRRRRRRLLKKGAKDDVPKSLRTFTYKELQIATKNFKNKLGSGGFGSVFKGTLPDNTLVAVKRLQCSAQAEKQFRAEISTIGKIQHVNLVRLWGFCVERSQRLLVYEYMPNGSLNSSLFCKSVEAEKLLDWKTRFQIALGTARGLVYLHEECRDRIIHGDIRPENILLDCNFCPKLADFGIAKLVGRDFSHILTTMSETPGYLAPEWICGFPITPKVDVYSFGMTLLEIISGRRNLDWNAGSSRFSFPTWAATQIQRGNIMGVVDARIASKADILEVRRAGVVGGLCIEEDENRRPSMNEVVKMLEGWTEVPTPQIPVPIPRSLHVLVDQGKDGPQSDSFV